jgi:hypothetical protein
MKLENHPNRIPLDDHGGHGKVSAVWRHFGEYPVEIIAKIGQDIRPDEQFRVCDHAQRRAGHSQHSTKLNKYRYSLETFCKKFKKNVLFFQQPTSLPNSTSRNCNLISTGVCRFTNKNISCLGRTSGRHTTHVADQVHCTTVHAANTLWVTLPNAHKTVFIISSTRIAFVTLCQVLSYTITAASQSVWMSLFGRQRYWNQHMLTPTVLQVWCGQA